MDLSKGYGVPLPLPEILISESRQNLLYNNRNCPLSRKRRRFGEQAVPAAAGGYGAGRGRAGHVLAGFHRQIAFSAGGQHPGFIQGFREEKITLYADDGLVIVLFIFLLIRGGDQDTGHRTNLHDSR